MSQDNKIINQNINNINTEINTNNSSQSFSQTKSPIIELPFSSTPLTVHPPSIKSISDSESDSESDSCNSDSIKVDSLNKKSSITDVEDMFVKTDFSEENIPYPPGNYLNPAFHFFSDCKDILSYVSSVLKKIKIEVIDAIQSHRLYCIVFLENVGRISFIVRFFATPENLKSLPNTSTYVRKYSIEFQKRSGCSLSFLKIFHNSVSSLKQIIDVRLPGNMNPMPRGPIQLDTTISIMNSSHLKIKEEKDLTLDEIPIDYKLKSLHSILLMGNSHFNYIQLKSEALNSIYSLCLRESFCRNIIINNIDFIDNHKNLYINNNGTNISYSEIVNDISNNTFNLMKYSLSERYKFLLKEDKIVDTTDTDSKKNKKKQIVFDYKYSPPSEILNMTRYSLTIISSIIKETANSIFFSKIKNWINDNIDVKNAIKSISLLPSSVNHINPINPIVIIDDININDKDIIIDEYDPIAVELAKNIVEILEL